MFLENVKASGGGDIVDYLLDSKKKILSANYLKPTCKARILERRLFDFLGYEFSAFEPLNPNVFTEENNSIILNNFSHQENIQNVQMFAENLVVEENEVNWIVLSK